MMSLDKFTPAWVKRIGLVTVLGLFVAGVVFWGGFNWALESTNKEAFCISCHEMEENVFREYQNTIHYTNRTGVRATCPDCHVPKEWVPKIIRKIQASNEVLHKILGTIDTPAKFNAKRPQLAQNECGSSLWSVDAIFVGVCQNRTDGVFVDAEASESGNVKIYCFMHHILKQITESALRGMARVLLRKYHPLVVGVTGSVGKSSTKEAIVLVLSQKYSVRGAEGNYNNEIGIPLTILGSKSGEHSFFRWVWIGIHWLGYVLFPLRYPEVLVLEMGIDSTG